MKFNTQLLHGKAVQHYENGATLPSISQVSAFTYSNMEELEKVFAHRANGFAYTRIGNPTVAAFEQRIAELEHGISALATSSGMSAISQTLLTILSAGDEIVSTSTLYGGSLDLLENLKALGIKVHFVSHPSLQEIEKAVTPATKLIFAETLGNPSLEILDIKGAAQIAHANQIPLIVDSTMATPFLCTPLTLGADIVIHSSSKYINGSSDSISGVIVDGGKFKWSKEKFPALAEYTKFGPGAFSVRLRTSLAASFGGCLSPFNAYMNIIGLETLGLRMERICKNAEYIARGLEKIQGISVNYPLLENSPYRELALSQLNAYGGGIVTLRAGSKEKALKTIDSLKYALIASNIGDVRTLALYPASTLYIHSTKEAMNAAGVFDDTIRLSIGIEDADDILEDLREAIAQAN